MKLKRRPTGLSEIKARMKRARADLEEKIGPLDQLGLEPDVVERMVGGHNRYLHRDGESPVDAHERGVGYSGPLMPDKGLKDGSCNRTACQLPLRGQEQWTMKDHMTGGKLYYCADCAMKFHEADRQFGEPLRCSLVEG